MSVLEVVVLLVAGLMVGNELAVSAFVHPTLTRQEDAVQAAVVQSLARLYGKVMPFWYFATLGLSILLSVLLHGAHSAAFGYAALASLLWAAASAFSIILEVPINNEVAGWNLAALPANWRERRATWDRQHVVRVGMLLVAFVCLAFACIAR